VSRFLTILALAAGINSLPCVWVSPALADQTLTILHTSEHHGQVLPIEQQGQPNVGGVAGRATLIAQIRGDTPALLLVDSGDILIGTALSSFFRGEPDIKAMNLMGYQAMAAGNHDFDFGLDHLRSLQHMAKFPILCSNVVGRTVDLPCRPFTVIPIAGRKIGVIGLLGRSNFPDTFNRQVAKLLEFKDPAETARTLARTLREQERAELVVAVTHQGTSEDLALLAQVPEVDVIIGGHSEGFDGLRTAGSSAPMAASVSPGSVFVKTHRQGRTLGRLDLILADKPDPPGQPGVVRATAHNLPVLEAVPPDPAVLVLVAEYARKLEAQTASVVGRSAVTLDGENTRIRTHETNLGNLLADLLRAEFRTEVALVNSGQIRDSIPRGPVELKRILRVLPFDSPAVTFALTGRELLLALENSVSQLPEQTAGRFLQVSGLAVGYDLAAPLGSRVRTVSIGGKPLEATRAYSVATVAFLADGGDGYSMFAGATDRIDRQLPLRDLLLQALHAGPLNGSEDGRIAFVEHSR
jgi:5'-nucleotidase